MTINRLLHFSIFTSNAHLQFEWHEVIKALKKTTNTLQTPDWVINRAETILNDFLWNV